MKNKKPVNPFYLVLLLAGVAFGITACAYGVMTARQLRSSRIAGYRFDSDQTKEPANFNEIIDRYGAKAMILEIILLGIGTVGAIAYDQRIDKQIEQKEQPQGETL